MIAVLNCGSQFAHLIARRVRDLGVKAEVFPYNIPAAVLKRLNPAGIILSGSPASVLLKGSPRPDGAIFNLGVPILGICYGEQVMAQMLGGAVRKGTRREYGKEILRVEKPNGIFTGRAKRETVWFSHGDQVVRLPRGFRRICSTPHCPNAGMADAQRNLYAIQFHPEVSHTVHGKQILQNFIFGIARAKKNWRIADLKNDLIREMRETVGRNHVLIGISGGVDSLVAATLLYRAIGNRLHAVLVDTGLLRQGEAAEVAATLRKRGFRNLDVIKAGKVF